MPLEARKKDAMLNSWMDGLWWSVQTVTGVGYGDVYPVSNTGRVVGMVLQVSGLIVFALIVGQIAVELFRAKDDFYWKRMFKRIDELEARIVELDKKQRFLIADADLSVKPKDQVEEEQI